MNGSIRVGILATHTGVHVNHHRLIVVVAAILIRVSTRQMKAQVFFHCKTKIRCCFYIIYRLGRIDSFGCGSQSIVVTATIDNIHIGHDHGLFLDTTKLSLFQCCIAGDSRRIINEEYPPQPLLEQPITLKQQRRRRRRSRENETSVICVFVIKICLHREICLMNYLDKY